MEQLASFLKAYMTEHGLKLRDMELRSGVSRTVINSLITGKEHEPRLTTLAGIARAVELPLWRIIALAGVELELPDATTSAAAQLAALAARSPTFERLLERLLLAHEAQLQAVVNYLETPDAERVYDLRITIQGPVSIVTAPAAGGYLSIIPAPPDEESA